MNFSFRNRRDRVIVAAVVGLVLSGFAAAVPALAHASTDATPAVIGTPVITDTITAGTVTGPDAILTCATSQIAIGGTEAIAVPVGCLTLYNGEFVQVAWSGTGLFTKLTMQTDANFVLYAGNGKKWGAGTRFVDNPTNGPGCLAQFQSDANLVVRNCSLAAEWASNTHTYPNAILAFQADGNLVIYDAISTHKALWATGT